MKVVLSFDLSHYRHKHNIKFKFIFKALSKVNLANLKIFKTVYNSLFINIKPTLNISLKDIIVVLLAKLICFNNQNLFDKEINCV